jgi:hypothetical protein
MPMMTQELARLAHDDAVGSVAWLSVSFAIRLAAIRTCVIPATAAEFHALVQDTMGPAVIRSAASRSQIPLPLEVRPMTHRHRRRRRPERLGCGTRGRCRIGEISIGNQRRQQLAGRTDPAIDGAYG